MTKLCCLNQDNPHCSAFECHTELVASELSPGSLKLSRFEPTGLDSVDTDSAFKLTVVHPLYFVLDSEVVRIFLFCFLKRRLNQGFVFICLS